MMVSSKEVVKGVLKLIHDSWKQTGSSEYLHSWMQRRFQTMDLAENSLQLIQTEIEFFLFWHYL